MKNYYLEYFIIVLLFIPSQFGFGQADADRAWDTLNDQVRSLHEWDSVGWEILVRPDDVVVRYQTIELDSEKLLTRYTLFSSKDKSVLIKREGETEVYFEIDAPDKIKLISEIIKNNLNEINKDPIRGDSMAAFGGRSSSIWILSKESSDGYIRLGSKLEDLKDDPLMSIASMLIEIGKSKK